MAETGTTTSSSTTTSTSGSTTTARKPAARKSTARKSTARKPAARKSTARTSTRSTTRSTASKSPSATTARRRRTTAARTTRQAASANATAAGTTAAQGRNLAERAALVYVGATVEARDRVVELAEDLMGRYGSRAAVERTIKRSRSELEKDVRRFERKGTTTRNRLTKAAEREARRRRTMVSEGIATVSDRVEGAMQVGVATGERFAALAKERVGSLA
jgi:hypothetical protein